MEGLKECYDPIGSHEALPGGMKQRAPGAHLFCPSSETCRNNRIREPFASS